MKKNKVETKENESVGMVVGSSGESHYPFYFSRKFKSLKSFN
jgi:hypothetical protein